MDEKLAVSTNALNALNAAVKEAHPKFVAKFEAKAVAAGIDPTAASPVEGFCALCAQVRPFLNMAIKAAGFFNSGIAAMAKTFMTAVYGTLIPLVCGKQQ